MDTTSPDVKQEHSPDTEWASMQAPTMTPAGSRRGSGDEFVEVWVNDEEEKSAFQERDTAEGEEGNEGADTTPQSPPRPVKMTTYDANADLVLIIAPEENDDNDKAEYHFQVSSKSLAFSSSVWKSLISSVSGPTSEKEGKVRTLLVTDDINSLTIFLKIIHLQFSALPVAPTFEEIHLLAQFSEKYAAHEIFLPFTLVWTRPLMPEGLKFERKEWILIAWEFCLGNMFGEWVEFLSRESEAGSDGTVTYERTEVSEFLPKTCPGEYAEYIQDTRKAFLSDLITVSYARLGQSLCLHPNSLAKNQCNALKDGYLMGSLKDLLGEWKWPLNAGWIDMPPREFKEKLLSMDFEPLPMPPKKWRESHSDCGISFSKRQIRDYSFTGRNSWGKGANRVLQLPAESFTKERRDVETRMLPK